MRNIILKIFNGQFVEGDLLPGEIELANEFNVSRTSIRAALQTIANKGVISIVPKRGSVINKIEQWNWLDQDILTFFSQEDISPTLLQHLLITRLIFEPNICAIAALSSTVQDLIQIEHGYQLMQESIKENKRDLFLEGDKIFHSAIVNSCKNPFLSSLDAMLSTAMSVSYNRTLEQELSESITAVNAHGDLLEAIRMREAQKAKDISKQLISNAVTKILPNQDLYHLIENL
ncbi:FadR/GntR family transcriptional regulator [Gallibacterium melopsittaci]|uniref:FadR/GntR family transcriptional regulator n=1 Tax=Gallibacterium melopsittaci TaxID=516063 RepID=A0ABV6HT89_9PAST